jgi:hypothetical protein
LPALGLLDSKTETQGQLSRCGGVIRPHLGLLHLTRGTVKTEQPQVWDWTRAAEFQWNSCPRRPSGGTKEVDGGQKTEDCDKRRTSGAGASKRLSKALQESRSSRSKRRTSGAGARKRLFRELQERRSSRSKRRTSGEGARKSLSKALQERRSNRSKRLFRALQEHKSSRSKRRISGGQPAKQGQQQSCRASEEPAVPRYKHAQGRTSHQQRQARSASEQGEPDTWCARGTSGGARRNSRTAGCGRSNLRGSCLLWH